jgi:hypothetical protein
MQAPVAGPAPLDPGKPFPVGSEQGGEIPVQHVDVHVPVAPDQAVEEVFPPGGKSVSGTCALQFEAAVDIPAEDQQ